MVMESVISATTAIDAIKKQAEPMYTALTKVQADPGFVKLSKEVRELLAELLQGLKKPEAVE